MKDKKVSAVVSSLCLALVVGAIPFMPACKKSAPPATSDPVKVSEDQESLINRFGYPDTFVLAMRENIRIEIWTYYTMERSFIFLDGEFANDEFIAELPEGFNFPKFRPTQFSQGMSFAQAKQILGQPTAMGELIPELMENTTIYDFHDQVKVAVKDAEVIYVQTLPVTVRK